MFLKAPAYAKDVEARKIETAGPKRPRKKKLYAKKGQGKQVTGSGPAL